MLIGDKVRVIDGKNHGLKVGTVGIIINRNSYKNEFLIKPENETFSQWLEINQLELILETSLYYSFFRFLHPNMEETTCKELFDVIIKKYESNSGVK